MNEWNVLIELINKKSERSGFIKLDLEGIEHLKEQAARKDPDILATSVTPPDAYGEHVWYSDYALISVHHIAATEPREFIRKRLAAERYLDALLVGLETPGTALDGYLILAFPNEPVHLNRLIAETEQDTRLVRKHVVTFKEGRWCRLERMGVLALNHSEEAEATEQPSGIDEAGLALIVELESVAGSTLAQQHAAKWGDTSA